MSAAIEQPVDDAVARRRERWRRKEWLRRHPGHAFAPPRSREWRRWTKDEDDAIRWQWGVGWESRPFSISYLAELLGRTPAAVAQRAQVVLGLRAAPAGTITLAELVARSGYHEATVKRVAEHLGLKLEECVSSTPGRRLRPQRYAIEPETADAILGWLRERGALEPFKRRGRQWGESLEPEACLCCGSDAGEPRARGLCHACYQRAWRAGRLDEYRRLTGGEET